MLTTKKNISKSREIIAFALEKEVDVMMMAEINIRWNKVPTENQWGERVYGIAKKEKHVFGYNKNDEGILITQYGGTGISVVGDITHHVIEVGMDYTNLERWYWSLLRGWNDQKVRIISAYRLCEAKGLSTVGRQHQRYFQKNGEYDDVREKMLINLAKECKNWIENRELIILSSNMNEDVRSKILEEFAEEVRLINVILKKHEDKSPPAMYNWNQQRQPIDGIWVSTMIQCEGTSFLPFDHGIRSDHWGIWVDITYEEVLGFAYPPMDCGSRRKLNLKDSKLVK